MYATKEREIALAFSYDGLQIDRAVRRLRNRVSKSFGIKFHKRTLSNKLKVVSAEFSNPGVPEALMREMMSILVLYT